MKTWHRTWNDRLIKTELFGHCGNGYSDKLLIVRKFDFLLSIRDLEIEFTNVKSPDNCVTFAIPQQSQNIREALYSNLRLQ